MHLSSNGKNISIEYDIENKGYSIINEDDFFDFDFCAFVFFDTTEEAENTPKNIYG